SSDMRGLRGEPAYPLTGQYATKAGKVTLPNKEIGQTNWTFMAFQDKTTLWRPSAVQFWDKTKKVDPWGVLYATTDKPDEIWERKGFRRHQAASPARHLTEAQAI